MTEQKRCLIIESCGKCQNSRQKGSGHWYCNAPGKTPWTTVLDSKPILPDKIPNYCPLPVYPVEHEQEIREKAIVDKIERFCLTKGDSAHEDGREHEAKCFYAVWNKIKELRKQGEQR